MKDKIALIPYLPHLSFFYDALEKHVPTVYIADKSAAVYIKNQHLDSVIFTPIHFFRLEILRYRLGIQTNLPLIVHNLSVLLSKNDISVVVCFDFFHLYAIQALRYKKRHPNVKLIIYSETKQWPRNWLSRNIMYVFLWYVRRHITQINHVLVYTEEGKEWWQEQVPEVKVSVLPAPVNTETFAQSPSKNWLPNGTLRILMNARYSPYKRHEDIFKAIAELQSRGRKIQLTLIGRDDGGRTRIEMLAEEYDCSDLVTFLDPKPMNEMPLLYHQHDVLVLPSYNEAIGMVVPEAMACGIPTITSDTVGANVYVRSGETGWIFETSNVNALVEALEECYESTELKKRGESAQVQIKNNFSGKIIASNFISLLDELS